MTELLGLSLEELKTKFKELNLPAYRAEQVYGWAMGYSDFSEMTNLPKTLRDQLSISFAVKSAEIHQKLTSKDRTVKYLLKLSDNNLIECVLLRQDYGDTLCISTQVGCRMGCAFCASGQEGLVRNLTAAEMMAEVLLINRDNDGTKEKRAITNIVLMGCGEPLDNYDNTVKFLRLITSENSLNISARNISLSTCGLVKQLRRFTEEKIFVTLAISLHSPFEDRRKEIMPIANAYSLKQIMEAAREYFTASGRRVILEYALIEGFNTREEDALKLKELTKNMSCHINLIPLNRVKGSELTGANRDESMRFLNRLAELNLSVTMRKSTGSDIDGSCGQLRQRFVGCQNATNSDKKG